MMSNRAEVKMITEDNGTTVIGIGELDLRIAKEFDAALVSAVSSAKPVTVDLVATNFIDSAILHSLLAHARVLDARGDRLQVVVASDSYPDYVLKTVGFDCLMDINARQHPHSAEQQ